MFRVFTSWLEKGRKAWDIWVLYSSSLSHTHTRCSRCVYLWFSYVCSGLRVLLLFFPFLSLTLFRYVQVHKINYSQCNSYAWRRYVCIGLRFYAIVVVAIFTHFLHLLRLCHPLHCCLWLSLLPKAAHNILSNPSCNVFKYFWNIKIP